MGNTRAGAVNSGPTINMPTRLHRYCKYKNKRTNGYASKKEANYAVVLRSLFATGKITCLQEQIRYELLPAMGSNRAVHYVLDFMYRDDGGKWHYVDVKGYKTEVYKLKKKMMLAVHGIEIEEV